MSFESLMAASRRLSVTVEALAALGARLRLRQQGIDGDPRVRALLDEVVLAVNSQLLDGVDIRQEAAVLAFIQTTFRQASELLENPERAPGWSSRDPIVLQSQGQLSRVIVRGIDAIATQRPEIAAVLRQPGAFLDIGTGVGWLAIEAARSWQSLRVIGVDPWEPALTLARENLTKSGLADRVEFRLQPVEQLDVTADFTLAWLPGPFISAKIADQALERIHRALVPGGWLIFGINAPPRGSLEEAISALRSVRSGGHPWTPQEVERRLRASGFERIETLSPGLPVLFVVGQRMKDVGAGAS